MRRLLFVAHRLPYPPDKGERVRAFHEIQALREAFHVTVAAPVSPGAAVPAASSLAENVVTVPDGSPRATLRAAWTLLTGSSASRGRFDSIRLRRHLRRAQRGGAFDLVVAYCSSMVPAALSVPAAAHVADLVDADSAKWTAYADNAAWPRRWIYARESRAIRRLEQQAARDCDAVVCVSDAELDALGLTGRADALAVGNGVDAAYFHAAAPEESEPGRIVFTGTMSYRPNADAVCWFAREVLPGVRDAVPEASFAIVGREPAPAVRQLAGAPGVEVTGAVPDVRPYLSRAAAVVCPLRLARGVQNKVLEAMAMARPVVASPAALEGLEAEPGRHVLRADSAAAFRDAVVGLLTDSRLRETIGTAARGHVERHYTWDARLAPLVELCRRLAGRREEPRKGDPSPTAAQADGEEGGQS